MPDARPIRRWLAVVAAMVFAMVVIGALTRLTESGLSMVDWRPVTGWLPPLTDTAWQAELAKYAASPQGRLVNHGITVEQFKGIFWLEYFHRLWGRLIGLAYGLPLLWFMLRRGIPPGLTPHLLGLLALGGLQGLMGWLMVASGLIDRPSVSHYRLAAHLALAAILYAWLMALVFRLAPARTARPAGPGDGRVLRLTFAVIGLLAATMVWGAFVAGLRAGQVHTTFPTMSGYWLPPGLIDTQPAWLSFVGTQTGTQFVHRLLAAATLIACLALWWRARRDDVGAGAWPAANMTGAMVALQFALGVATILSGAQIALATLHQAGAFLLLTALTLLACRLAPPRR
ncbi:MAG: COX15/CtaA family protein [Rhodospirillales bacterium]|nr:MAG: COX15/CtaA family protein [Rhodospirillales bacterium]